MKTGKVPISVLEKSIFPYLGNPRPEVLVHSMIGEDCSVLDFGDYVCVLSTDPITGADKESGSLAIHVSCNDVAANGAEPIGVLITILFPEGTTQEDIKHIMEQIHKTAKKLNIEVLGGHTEITSVVDKVVISSTAVGKALKTTYTTSSNAQIGDQIIVTKSVGLEGTAILASDFEEILAEELKPHEIQTAQSFIDHISVIPEGLIAAKNGANAMHDITEGGVLGAVYELAMASKKGVEIWEEKIPVHPLTRKVCSIFNIDPLRLISSGSMLITAPPEADIVSKLKEKNIYAAVIGKITEKELKLIRKNETIKIIPPERDELYVVIEKNSKK